MNRASVVILVLSSVSACSDPQPSVPATQSAVSAGDGSADGSHPTEDARQLCPKGETDGGIPVGKCPAGVACTAIVEPPCLAPNVGLNPEFQYLCVCAGEWKCTQAGPPTKDMCAPPWTVRDGG